MGILYTKLQQDFRGLPYSTSVLQLLAGGELGSDYLPRKRDLKGNFHYCQKYARCIFSVNICFAGFNEVL